MSTATIKLVSLSAKDADSIINQIKTIAVSLNVKCKGPVALPTRIISHTTRKTPCGTGSDTYERWQIRVHKRLIKIIDVSEHALRQILRIPVPDTVQIEISLT
ncbi:MAG: 30S ribosomal protein S10 [Candidatus Micrarchaeaceae archaeon]